MAAKLPTSGPSTSIKTAGRSGDESLGVGNDVVGSLAAQRGFAVGEHPRRACLGVVHPPRRLGDDTDAMRPARCREDADRPFFHGLAEQLRPGRSLEAHSVPA